MKFDIYQVITDRIIELLEAGAVPWRRPWKDGEPPQNLLTRKPYRGVNAFLLNASILPSPFWLSMRQVNAAGGTVRKGEKAHPVVFWKLRDIEKAEDEKQKRVPFLRYYNVFNVSQCDNLPPTLVPKPARDFEPLERCESVVANMPRRPEILPHAQCASYSPVDDKVYMPDRMLFDSSEGYYTTLFHELTHATGHKSRLARKEVIEAHRFGSEPYSREELVAEMGAAFLSGYCGIEQKTVSMSAGYIQSWLNRLRDDRKLVIFAAAQAQRACDFIRCINVSSTGDAV